ncbi:DUF4870 domain-containing protein [Staphylococcus simulans]|uniref:DUF4870 domain-containing protein n=1 Tax=Staphylococcus simulans TaxID=1286 RepID=UPI0018EEA6A8|nr:DUF4870 domain-containing protein [Staphylococcus simulans]MDY5061326.1 DUF4870 domain-containing protein [Staphylococcus simulans]
MTKDHSPEQVTEHIEVYQQFPTEDARLFACLIYVLSFFTTIIGPLIIWLTKGSESYFVDKTAKNYFNFVISYTIWTFIALILCLMIIGMIILPVLGILSIVFSVVAAVKAYNGEEYLIPLSIRFFN